MSGVRWWRRHDEVPVVELGRSNPVRFAIVFLVIVAIAIYFGFTKHIPFKHGFQLKAQFATAVNIPPKSPVRIAATAPLRVSAAFRSVLEAPLPARVRDSRRIAAGEAASPAGVAIAPEGVWTERGRGA